jgi:hypothetical protein
MEDGARMPKRAERRHHEDRVKTKFKKVVKQQTKWMVSTPGHWELKWENGKLISRRFILDKTLGVERLQTIEKQGAQMAHHPQHQCVMCHPGKKELKHKHEFELARKSPEIDDGED